MSAMVVFSGVSGWKRSDYTYIYRLCTHQNEPDELSQVAVTLPLNDSDTSASFSVVVTRPISGFFLSRMAQLDIYRQTWEKSAHRCTVRLSVRSYHVCFLIAAAAAGQARPRPSLCPANRTYQLRSVCKNASRLQARAPG